MRVLIVDDDFISRRLMQKMLSEYGECDIAVDGVEAIRAFELAWEEGRPYDLICMDIVMPNIDGQQALKRIRSLESEMWLGRSQEVRVIMTTSLADPDSVADALFKGGATGYLVKPISKPNLLLELKKLWDLKLELCLVSCLYYVRN
ncbi:MAG: response regulator [candidate division WOR-3 bacterium]